MKCNFWQTPVIKGTGDVMKNDPLYHNLLEASWRRRLTEAEQAQLRAWLDAHPENQADWEAEAGLSAALNHLPDAPVPTNFTSRVMLAIEREGAKPRQPSLVLRQFWQWRRRWLPRAGFATLLLGAALFSYREVRAARGRAEMARSVATIVSVPSLPSPQVLKDFDAIWAMDPSPPPDEELLMLLK
jgi:anti-sigma factor RsiW